MKDPHDRKTLNLPEIPMANSIKFKVNYGYAIRGKLRTGALIIDATDAKDAQKKANATLAAEHDWHQLNSIVQLTSTNTQP